MRQAGDEAVNMMRLEKFTFVIFPSRKQINARLLVVANVCLFDDCFTSDDKKEVPNSTNHFVIFALLLKHLLTSTRGVIP